MYVVVTEWFKAPVSAETSARDRSTIPRPGLFCFSFYDSRRLIIILFIRDDSRRIDKLFFIGISDVAITFLK